MPKVLCFGSLNIDYVYMVDHFVRKGETISSTNLNIYCGGKGLNQSVALGRAGCNIYHAGLIGEDGKFLLDILSEANVNTSHIDISDCIKTGNAIIQNDKDGDNCIILYPGANHAITKELVDEVLKEFSEGDYLVLQNEISEMDYITETAYKKGMVIVLNPSPVNDNLTDVILSRASWMILNEIEAMQLTDSVSKKEEDLIERLRLRYPEQKIVLTLGIQGSCYIDKEMHVHQDSIPVMAVDTTAAGDTFTGYFIYGLINAWNIQKCLEMAAKASAIAVSKQGAAPSIPLIEEVLVV